MDYTQKMHTSRTGTNSSFWKYKNDLCAAHSLRLHVIINVPTDFVRLSVTVGHATKVS